MVNLTTILSDKEHWKYPDTFNPENFLDDNRCFYKPEAFLPFSLGESPSLCDYKISRYDLNSFTNI